MTIIESIIDWLYKNDSVKDLEYINTELLLGQIGALSKLPTNIVDYFNDGSQIRTEYYTFLTHMNTQLNTERISNERFFEDLENWIEEKNIDEDYPVLGKNLYCENISVSGGHYQVDTGTHESTYSLTLEIVYRKERG